MPSKTQLTEAFIRNAAPQSNTRIYWDHAVRGLGVRITSGGAKAYVLQYRSKGTSRRSTLAQCAAISLRRAREIAGEQLVSIRNGDDPLQRRQDAMAAPTVSSAMERFFAEDGPRLVASGRMVQNTLTDYRKQAERHIRPVLGSLKVADVKRNDVERMLARIKGRIQRNRVQVLTSRLFAAFEGWEIRPQQTNPVKGITKVREHARRRIFTPVELKRMGEAIADLNCPAHRAALRFLILTGWRTGEVLSLTWNMVNFETGIVDMPSTKVGPSRRTVSAIALALLDDLPRTSSGVFHPTSYPTLRHRLLAVCRIAGVEDARLHDCHRTFASTAAADGMSAFVLQGLLGHANITMSARYVQLSSKVLDEAGHSTTSHVAAMLEGRDADIEDLDQRRKTA